MYLVIAEKPSVSRAIAEVIGAQEREDGYLQGTDCMVSWCFGHLAELAGADVYDEKYAKWRYDDLPILPTSWRFTLKADKAKQFELLRDLMRREDVTEVITLVKDTSLVRVIAVYEIMWNGERFIKQGIIWPLFFTGVYYLLFSGILTVLLGKLEKKLDYFKV